MRHSVEYIFLWWLVIKYTICIISILITLFHPELKTLIQMRNILIFQNAISSLINVYVISSLNESLEKIFMLSEILTMNLFLNYLWSHRDYIKDTIIYEWIWIFISGLLNYARFGSWRDFSEHLPTKTHCKEYWYF